MKVLRVLTVLSLSAFLHCSIQAQCNAGSDATLNICSDASPVGMVAALDGSPMAGGAWIDASGAAFSGVFDPAIDTPGMYRYVISTDAMGNPCALNDTATLTVNVSQIPVVSFISNTNEGCGSSAIQFTNTSVAPGYTTCIWDFGDGGASTACNPLYNFTSTGIYDVSLTLSNGIGCQSTHVTPAAIEIKEAPEAGFSMAESSISSTTGIGNFINESSNATSYEWIIPMVGNFSEEDPLVTFPAEEASYFVCLEATAANGCEDTYCATVFVRDETIIYVPSAFTPNSDRVNDFFRPKLTFSPQIYEFQVFDKWGIMIFESTDPELGWNGSSSSGESYSSDNYYAWRIKAVKDASIIERKGKVLMLR